MSNTAKHFIDAASIGGTIATLAGWLPPFAALVSILWVGFQFYHSAPVAKWRKERKERKEKAAQAVRNSN